MFVTRSLFQAAQKVTTGIYGFPVHPNPRPVLIDLYKKTLTGLETKIPAHAVYRQAATAITQHRLKVVEKNSDVSKIEQEIDNGQIEELIWAAEDELKLVDKMAEWKP
ncbi:hypothetical protein H4R34_005398 [Dimargaris verticillata]|uniref:ETC complex I subunit conserved region-domain-containing protein n=1 Tax=Dimargaris verticillata TaxID=2761393 RepID=A0A9W8B2B9_9FUNG|nr:hypothetical protein H4R34_005398 [Dimargaris verticillata]